MNAIDLCTVADVSAYLGDTTVDTTLLQRMVTAFSQYVLTRTNRANLSSQQTYTERYNGNGSERLMVRNYPIVSVASLTINGTNFTQSPDGVQSGFVIDTAGSCNSLVLIGGTPWSPWRICDRFTQGTQNVAITYTAGYNGVPYDLNQAAISIVAENYRKRNWIGQASQMQPGVGTTSYRSWILSPTDNDIINQYAAKFLP